MIVPFFVVKNSTGAIVRTGQCQQEALSYQAGTGETARQGTADDATQRWASDLGALVFVRRLQTLGIACEHQEFDDGHRSTAYRYDISLPKLAAAIGATAG